MSSDIAALNVGLLNQRPPRNLPARGVDDGLGEEVQVWTEPNSEGRFEFASVFFSSFGWPCASGPARTTEQAGLAHAIASNPLGLGGAVIPKKKAPPPPFGGYPPPMRPNIPPPCASAPPPPRPPGRHPKPCEIAEPKPSLIPAIIISGQAELSPAELAPAGSGPNLPPPPGIEAPPASSAPPPPFLEPKQSSPFRSDGRGRTMDYRLRSSLPAEAASGVVNKAPPTDAARPKPMMATRERFTATTTYTTSTIERDTQIPPLEIIFQGSRHATHPRAAPSSSSGSHEGPFETSWWRGRFWWRYRGTTRWQRC